MRKAQVEFIVILALVFVIVVVVYYATQGSILPSPIPSGIFEQQKLVQNSVVNLIRKGADKTLNVMETHGGYLTQEMIGEADFEIVPYTLFTNDGIPYWQRCNQLSIPSKSDVKGMLEFSISNYIKKHIAEVAYAKNVSFDLANLSVSSNILRDKIEITVRLPTTLNGYEIREPLYPYKTSIPSKFGEIYNFASDFSRESADKRFFETFTMASLYLSQTAPDGHPKLPTIGTLTRCGEAIYRMPDQISFYLMEIAEYVLTHILWWQPMIDQAGKPETKVFAIESVNGKKYADLRIRFYLPDDFAFEVTNPIIITNSKIILRAMSPFVISDCLSVYQNTYSVSYPVIVKVDDPLTGYDFNFAVLVFVDEEAQVMKPGKCENIGVEEEEICSDLGCSARIEVVDQLTKEPLEKAIVSFGDCVIGYTDMYGIAEGPIDCGVHELHIYYKKEHEFYNRNVSSSNINATYELHRVPNMTIHFRKVDIKKEGQNSGGNPVSCYPCSPGSCQSLDSWEYTRCETGYITRDYVFVDMVSAVSGNEFSITNIDPGSVPEGCDAECIESCQAGGLEACKQCLKNCMGEVLESVNIDYIPGGNYDVDAVQLDLNQAKETGTFKTNHDIRGDEEDVYIHIPQSIPYYTLDGQEQCLTDVLKQCKIEPFSDETYVKTTIYANCDCVNLNKILPVFRDYGCITQQEIDSLVCECPAGLIYPSGCGQSCGTGPEPECTTCCDLNSLLNTIMGREAECGVRLVCA